MTGRSMIFRGALLLQTLVTPVISSAVEVRNRSIQVEGVNLFYREAGPADAPVLLLLHGRQTSSHMYRNLIPLLAARYRVIAPDLPGFGQSDTPDSGAFTYSFDHFAAITRELLERLAVRRFGLVMQDFGVPVGFRLAVAAPERIDLIVVQNGVICEPVNRQPVWLDAFWANRDPAAEQRLRNSYRLATTIRYYQAGAHDLQRISPDAWILSQYYLDQPGRHDAQVELMHDFASNFARYPAWQEYLRRYRPRTLVLWGRNSPIYSPEQAECFRQANPHAVLRFYDGGHFLLEEYGETAAAEILSLRPLRPAR
jgi:pimeloyl-ACP methyl ester carboxylesterase